MAVATATTPSTETVNHYPWWASLKHGGLLISPSKLNEFFSAATDPLPQYPEDQLRREVTRFRNENTDLGTLLDTVLETVLELDKQWWEKGTQVGSQWSYTSLTGERIKPRRIWLNPNGATLPVFTSEDTKIGIGRGKRSVSRVIEWLRKAKEKIALLTNGQQWRLIHAGNDYDAWCEWDIDFWFEQGKVGQQIEALRLLLGKAALTPSGKDNNIPLLQAIQASREGQAELSDYLGERVRQAVELLIQQSHLKTASIDALQLTNQHIYIAASRMIMRCVVILFAEARNLLPRDNPIYNSAYSLQGLREQLDKQGGGQSTERLRNSYSAFPRLLALFRLVYKGCAHEAMPIPCYGGGLFAPGDEQANDPILRALFLLEDSQDSPSDLVVHRILKLLTRSKVKVRQGRQNTWVEAPVDFSDLSSEYIGILYEGLLDFELRQADEDDPIIFLDLGDQPALPLKRLEGMDDKALASLVEKLKQKAKPETTEDEEEEPEAEASDEEEGEEEEAEPTETELTPETLADDGDTAAQLRERAKQWAIKAVKAGKLVPKPKSKKQEKQREYENQVAKMADRLIARIILPGDWFLVRWGGTRKGSGTFYTRPQLAVPTVQRTLFPLAYDTTTEQASHPKPPAEILGLKVCDPACGSASFLIGALRFLVDALWQSLFHHQWLAEDRDNNQIIVQLGEEECPSWFRECVKDFPITVENAEEVVQARLKRYVVERCIYGVDINPLAVELARLSLWVETMDQSLPFSFLDHKIKCGNSLIGCWFDRFQDYPVMAWEREGGDANHDKFVNHFREYVAKSGKKKGQLTQKGDKWTTAIKDTKNNVVKSELKTLLQTLDPNESYLDYPNFDLPKVPEAIHDEALNIFEELHNLSLYDSEERERRYREKIEGSEAIKQLKFTFDTWCSVWFWPAEQIDFAPTPAKFFDPPEDTKEIIEDLANHYQFFHWELEFPDVFASERHGFDGVIGNPPWDIKKPNSREFFSNVDPLYRTYGKQEALEKQQEYFHNNPQIEKDWLAYCAELKALSNWTKCAGFPFGDPEETGNKFTLSRSKKETEYLHELWRNRRNQQTGYADERHPFRFQGSADINTYKMFLELSLLLSRHEGRFGMIVPSGIYTDQGATVLREEFLSNCQWEWLFGFENRDKIFAIDSRQKFCPVILCKGGETEQIKATFMQRSLSSWEKAEDHVLDYSRQQVEQFSPYSKAILEIRSERDLEILKKIYSNSVLLGDDSPSGWGIQYATEFHMTNDSKLFPPRPKWESKGYHPDEYGHWLKGNWQPYSSSSSILERPQGLILSGDGTLGIQIDEVEDIALPLYQGVMIWQFNHAKSDYLRGASKSTKWIQRENNDNLLLPNSQFLASLSNVKSAISSSVTFRLGFRAVQNATNRRTMIATLLPTCPSGNSVATITSGSLENDLYLLSFLCSLPLDWVLRPKMSQGNVNWFYVEELATPNFQLIDNSIKTKLIYLSSSLNLTTKASFRNWIQLNRSQPDLRSKSLYKHLAINEHERLRVHCIIDAVVAELYGLEYEDMVRILKECDYPAEQVNNKTFSAKLDPKGFWRVDKEKDPELRHTVLSLIAFHDLKRLGLETFLNLNDGEGWMLPDTLTLADYGLGHDDRALQPQPVASRLGERYLPWQLEKTPEQSWEECERHAENLRQLLGETPQTFNEESSSNTYRSEKQLKLLQEDNEQLDLF